MRRRDFLKFMAAGASLSSLPKASLAYYDEIATWKTFRLNYIVTLPEDSASAKLWLPLPDANDTVFQRNMGSVWSSGPAKASLFATDSANSFFGQWQGKGERQITVGTMVKTAPRQSEIKIAKKSSIPVAVRERCLISPEDSIKATALDITRTAQNPIEKARSIYDWVIEHASYDPSIRGCGQGDAKSMLEKMKGKSADIASLFVGLCRAAGIPARESYGILLKNRDVTNRQHVRAEFYYNGWIPVDPAGVHRIVLDENLSPGDRKIDALKEKNFASWDMNWVEFNHERNVSLPAGGNKLPFFLYPYAEIAGEILDGRDPSSFVYRIEANELVGTGIKFSFKAS